MPGMHEIGIDAELSRHVSVMLLDVGHGIDRALEFIDASRVDQGEHGFV